MRLTRDGQYILYTHKYTPHTLPPPSECPLLSVRFGWNCLHLTPSILEHIFCKLVQGHFCHLNFLKQGWMRIFPLRLLVKCCAVSDTRLFIYNERLPRTVIEDLVTDKYVFGS